MKNAVEVDGDRLWETLEASGRIGRGKSSGLNRLTLSDGDRQMRDRFVDWCMAAGCTVAIDRFGNIFARRAGRDPDLKPILVGSHLDTQVSGGRYDGNLGVLAGLEIIRRLNDLRIETKRSIEIVCWTNEEGVRFQPPMMGSGAFTGAHEAEWTLAQIDEAGLTFENELKRIGYAGVAQPHPSGIEAYFELHIEQGPILEAEGVQVGIVTGGFASYGAELRVAGQNAHAGSTEMKDRRDALVGAAALALRVNEIGWKYAPKGRATCARMEVSPNRYGILADHARVTIDLRHPEPSAASEMYQAVLASITDCERRGNVKIFLEREWSFGGLTFDSALVNLVRSVAAELNVSHRHILSAAGHDAYHLSKVVPSVMIFTPCRDGLSHNENEHIERADTLPGVNVLFNAVLRSTNA